MRGGGDRESLGVGPRARAPALYCQTGAAELGEFEFIREIGRVMRGREKLFLRRGRALCLLATVLKGCGLAVCSAGEWRWCRAAAWRSCGYYFFFWLPCALPLTKIALLGYLGDLCKLIECIDCYCTYSIRVPETVFSIVCFCSITRSCKRVCSLVK